MSGGVSIAMLAACAVLASGCSKESGQTRPTRYIHGKHLGFAFDLRDYLTLRDFRGSERKGRLLFADLAEGTTYTYYKTADGHRTEVEIIAGDGDGMILCTIEDITASGDPKQPTEYRALLQWLMGEAAADKHFAHVVATTVTEPSWYTLCGGEVTAFFWPEPESAPTYTRRVRLVERGLTEQYPLNKFLGDEYRALLRQSRLRYDDLSR